MKNKKLLIILTIIEIITFIGLCFTLPKAYSLSVYQSVKNISDFWINTSSMNISEIDKLILNLNNIFLVLFIVVNLIRFIFIKFELKMIFIASIVISGGIFYLYLSDTTSLILRIITILCFFLSFIGIIYTHKIDRSVK